ncbi:hypothetical protein [Streptomyces sp. NPDC023327]|uniref:hypothetical protein n=1 Tax=Streptomyces sp. NPDC023327 TaxID=3157088 RepID=UPI0033C0F083
MTTSQVTEKTWKQGFTSLIQQMETAAENLGDKVFEVEGGNFYSVVTDVRAVLEQHPLPKDPWWDTVDGTEKALSFTVTLSDHAGADRAMAECAHTLVGPLREAGKQAQQEDERKRQQAWEKYQKEQEALQKRQKVEKRIVAVEQAGARRRSDREAARRREREQLAQVTADLRQWQAGGAVGGEPQRVRYTTRRATSVDLSGIYQQSLMFELIEETGNPDVRHRGRAVRISTGGTVFDTARLRYGMGHPLAGRFDSAKAVGRSTEAWDNQHVLDMLCLRLQPITPRGDEAHVHQSDEWILTDYSPVTENEHKVLSTSTSLGANLGFFADTPTGGVSYNYTTGTSWTLPDYRLGAAGGTDRSDGAYVAWSISRAQRDSDPRLAQSSLSPRLEAVFTLRPGVGRARYSAFACMTQVLLCVPKRTDPPKLEPSSAGDWVLLAALGPAIYLGAKVVHEDLKESLEHEEEFEWMRYAFVQSYVVDWEDARVHVVGVSEQEGRDLMGMTPQLALPRLVTTEVTGELPVDKQSDWHSIHADAVQGGDLEQKLDKLLNPPVPSEQPLEQTLRFSYRPGSAVGLAVVPAGCHEVLITVPAAYLGAYAAGLRVGGTDEPGSWSYDWLPGRRAVRVRRTRMANPAAVWIDAQGGATGLCTVMEDGLSAVVPVTQLGLPEVPDAVVPLLVDGADPAGEHLVFWRNLILRYRRTRGIQEHLPAQPVAPKDLARYPEYERRLLQWRQARQAIHQAWLDELRSGGTPMEVQLGTVMPMLMLPGADGEQRWLSGDIQAAWTPVWNSGAPRSKGQELYLFQGPDRLHCSVQVRDGRIHLDHWEQPDSSAPARPDGEHGDGHIMLTVAADQPHDRPGGVKQPRVTDFAADGLDCFIPDQDGTTVWAVSGDRAAKATVTPQGLSFDGVRPLARLLSDPARIAGRIPADWALDAYMSTLGRQYFFHAPMSVGD